MLLYFILLFTIIFCGATRGPNRIIGNYEQIILAQRSPTATYYDLRKIWPSKNISNNDCDLTKEACQALLHPNRWILRGLWPRKRCGSSPSSCLMVPNGYVMSFINSTLKERLKSKWPNLLKQDDLGSLWEFMWQKHGSCVKDIIRMKNVELYFSKALELLDKYNIGSMLEKYKIVPGKNYSVDSIYNLIQNEYRIEPRIGCLTVQNSQQEKVQYLLEATICFNKNLYLRSCFQKGYASCDKRLPLIYATVKEAADIV